MAAEIVCDICKKRESMVASFDGTQWYTPISWMVKYYKMDRRVICSEKCLKLCFKGKNETT